MKRVALALLLLAGLTINTACTSSNDSDADVAEEEMADPVDSTEGSVAEEESLSEDELSSEEDLAEDEVVADEGSSEELTEEVTGEATGESTGESTVADTQEEESAQVEGQELADGSISSEPTTEEPTEDITSTMSSDIGTSTDTTLSDASAPVDAPVSDIGSETPKAPVSLKKIKDMPFTQAGMLLNAVYIARQGDTWKSVGAKVYDDESKSKELKKANPFIARRSLKVGDKVYYNSPKRPQDADRMLTFYEDNGVPAQTYIAKEGENIREISKNLLGDKNSWKEIWSTNMAVESKAELMAGTELRYWTDSGISLTESTPPELPTAQAPIETPTPSESPAPAAPIAEVQDDFALPDEMNKNDSAAAAAGTVAVEPPPPPPPTPAPKAVASSGDDKDMTFLLAAGGLLLAGIGIILSIIKKNKARKMSMGSNTQI